MFFSRRVNPIIATAAAIVFATLALVVSYAMFSERLELLENSKQAEAIVVGIKTGVKGIKSVRVEFVAANGRQIVGHDIHKTQWFAANEVGDKLNIYYAPDSLDQAAPDILVDRGLWIWFEPLFLLCGGILLLALGVYLARNPGNS